MILTRAVRAVLGFGAERLARNDWLMGIVYDLINGEQFSTLGHHEEMLADTVRVEAYQQGIKNAVNEGDVVVDLGTGTGLLAFMASTAGATKVYALDHADVILLAKDVGAENGFTNIDYVQANSREFNATEPVDVVVHEQLNDELFGENMIENLLDIRDRVLRDGGRIVPGRFRLFVEPVRLHQDHRVPHIWDMNLGEGLDFTSLVNSLFTADPLRALEQGSDHLMLRRGAVESVLSEPMPVLEFDLMTLKSGADLERSHTCERVITEAGTVDGFCVWFEAIFDDEVQLNTSPLLPPTSWGNRLLRVPERHCDVGDVLSWSLELRQLNDASSWRAIIR
ncbi:MAG: protein arginine N-methyltransferase 1 [Ilumatobacter sp.]